MSLWTRVFSQTAISLPDPLFRRAEELAKRLGIPRSQLYAKALLEYLETHSAEQVITALDAVYTDVDSSLDAAISTAQAHTVGEDRW